MKLRNDKAKCLDVHSKRRAVQRLGLSLTDDDLQKMAELYRDNGKSVKLGKQSNRLGKGAVWFQEQWIPVVYDKERKKIVTVLSVYMLEPLEVQTISTFARKCIKNGRISF